LSEFAHGWLNYLCQQSG